MSSIKQKIILCDIDGTVADISHRLHYIDHNFNPGDRVKIGYTPNFGTFIKSKKEDGWEWPMYEVKLDSGQVVIWQTQCFKKVKYWRAFFEACPNDAPLVKNIQVVKALSSVYPVVFMSGRPEDYEKQTREWLRKYNLGGMYYMPDYPEDARTELFMRPSKDTREDYIVKEELYRKHIEPFYEVIVVIDDRKQVVSMWRKLGLNCWQVADGNF